MLKFFRNIRQRLLTQNKLGKYLIYAIGEIILVVIGILIALSINNSNENKKSRIREVSFLKEIESSLKFDSLQVQANINTLIETKKALLIIKEQLALDKQTNDSLDFYFSSSIQKNTIEVTKGAYASLKSAGIDLITNSTIRNDIIALYENSYPFTDKVMTKTYLSDDYVINYYARNFENVGVLEISDENKKWFSVGTITPNNIEELKKDKLYKTIINTKLREVDYLRYFHFEYLKNQINSIRNEIQKEIIKLNK